MSYPKQKKGRAVRYDERKFTRTAKHVRKCNINPRIMRGGIRL